ncbi:MAG: alkaline phosphatase D family protein [Actinobacteria bacterium]|nr:alkaline phosphatase D family protein [Actinomycetota bacterium]
MRLTRRSFLRASIVGGAASLLHPGPVGAVVVDATEGFDVDREGWGDGWFIDGVANLRVASGIGVFEAATDIYPADERHVAFLADHRVLDAVVVANFSRLGLAAGVVARRVAPRTHLAAIVDTSTGTISAVARTRDGETVIASAPAPVLRTPLTVSLEVTGADPTRVVATVTDADGLSAIAEGDDRTPQLQVGGDPGVLATSDTGFLSGPDAPPMFGSGRLVNTTPLAGLTEAEYRQVSVAHVDAWSVSSAEQPQPTVPSAVAVRTGAPADGGARVSVVADVPAEIAIEVAASPDLTGATRSVFVPTNEFLTLLSSVSTPAGAGEVFWRPVFRSAAGTSPGPVRRFRALPGIDDGTPWTLAIASCAYEFNTVGANPFSLLADLGPDVFVWEGDLNYPDSHGSLSQTVSGYAGIWREFLDAGVLAPIVDRCCFAITRDDHDYGVDDSAAADLADFGILPYEHIVTADPYYDFAAGYVHTWMLDQRRYKHDPEAPDEPGKSLIGRDQLSWLLDGLATSDAPFKIVCSPNPVFHPANDETCWGSAFTAEREVVLDHIAAAVEGAVVFVTGDSHSAAVVESRGVLELRPCPLAIPPPPGWHPPVGGDGVLFEEAGESYLGWFRSGDLGGAPSLAIELLRGDGSVAWSRTLTSDGSVSGGGRPDDDASGAPTDTPDLPTTGAGTALGIAATLGAAALSSRQRKYGGA